MCAFYDLMFIARTFLQHFHHYPCKDISQNSKALSVVLFQIGDKKLFLQVLVVSGKICEIQLEHHYHIVAVNGAETMHVHSVKYENIPLIQCICITPIFQYNIPAQHINHFHIIMKMCRIFQNIGSYNIDGQFILVDNFFF